jgi:2'-5' RNA ligase
MPPRNAYRIFVGAYPQGELAQRLDALRQKYDPKTARIIGPHVTLAGTYWRSGPATTENEAIAVGRLNEAARSMVPFDMVLGGIHTFHPAGKPVIYLGVEVTPELLAVRRGLLEVLGPDKYLDHFTPHLTLAMRLPAAKAGKMLDELRSSEWNNSPIRAGISALQFMLRGPGDPSWREIARAELCG